MRRFLNAIGQRFFLRLLVSAAVFVAFASVVLFKDAEFKVTESSLVNVRHKFVRKTAYFNKPDILYVGEPVTVRAVLSSETLTGADLSSVLNNLQGSIGSSKKLNLGQFVTVKLTAPATLLEITPQDMQPRKVGADDIVFVWYIKALQVGSIPISLAVFSQDDLKSNTAVQSFEVLDDTWTAEARGLPGLTYWIDAIKPIQDEVWVLAGGVAAVFSFFGLKTFGSNKKKEDEKTD